MPLTEMKVRNAKPKEKFYKLSDSSGLYLHVTETGSRLWRFKYRFNGKQKLLAFGRYPEISLLDARLKRDEARRQLAQGIDPSAVRKAKKQAHVEDTETVEVIAREWHEKFKSNWTEGHTLKILRALERDVFPWIGKRPIKEIKAPELLTVLRRVESRGVLEGAHRIRGLCSQFFRYAISTGRAERNPAQDLIGSLPPAKDKHLAAITDPKKVRELLLAIDGYSGSQVVKLALQLSPLVFVRPGELRHMEWKEVDFENALWSIPAEKMKMREPHLVPLSKQAINIMEELQKLTGTSKYAFPSGRTYDRPMSNNAILAALRRMGYTKDEMTPHGFRAMARTIIDEVLQVRPDFIEAQLAHRVSDPLGRSYNRTQHLNERKKMMQQWSDYLDGLRTGAKVLPFKQTKQ
ncbi:MAG: integrase arm-type DNA-binding domain-containing protein [Smithella sp.]|nr:integrase arm-type DNA-binding domain-containing protein [Smithella sp.]